MKYEKMEIEILIDCKITQCDRNDNHYHLVKYLGNHCEKGLLFLSVLIDRR